MLNAVEAGAYADGYLREMQILATEKAEYNFLSKLEENRHLFMGFFVAFRLGKTIEATGFQGQL